MAAPTANGFLEPRPPVAPWEWIALAAATLLGGALRFWALDSIPPGLWYDEAINGLDALSILREPGWPLFFDTRGHPREPMFMYLEAIGILVGGTSRTAIRAVSGVIGTATIPAVWWMVREWRGPRAAILAAFVFAGMRWHIHFSRLAFRTILSPLFAALAGALLARVLRDARRGDAVLLGLVLGLSLYTYLSMRLFLAAALLGGILAVAQGIGGARRPRLAAAAWCAAAGIAAFAPLGIHYIGTPEHFTGREQQISLIDQGPDGWRLIAAQGRDIALMPLLRGDHEGKHNLQGPPRFIQLHGWRADPRDWAAQWEDAASQGRPLPDPHGTGVPAFDPLTGLLVYAGFGLAAWQAVRRRDWPSQFVLLWIALGSLASALSFGAPNQLRLLLLTPAAAFLIAEALEAALAEARRHGRSRFAWAAIAVWGAWFLAFEAKRYFHDWPRHPDVYLKFNTPQSEAARWLVARTDRPATIIASHLVLLDAPTFLFEADGVEGLVADTSLEAMPEGRVWWLATAPPYPPLAVQPPAEPRPRVVDELALPDGRIWLRILETGG